MDLPVVNHKDYFAKIGDDHKFPINKFGDLADFLIRNKIVTKFHKPYPCSDETLKGAISFTNYNSQVMLLWKEKTYYSSFFCSASVFIHVVLVIV